MKEFRGVYTAIVTPFDKEGNVDIETYEKLVERQVKAGVAGVVPIGTTGESPTLHDDEVEQIINTTIEKCGSKCQVIAGTGTNSTEKTVSNSKKAEELGVDALLVVNPYYNKPTQEGLYRHFKAVADAVNIPVIWNFESFILAVIAFFPLIVVAEKIFTKKTPGSATPIAKT